MLRSFIGTAVALALTACGTQTHQPLAKHGSTDDLLTGAALFDQPILPRDLPNFDPMQLPPEIDIWLAQVGLSSNIRKPGALLIDLVNGPMGLHVSYDPTQTLTVTEAFRQRSANCLSYSMMIYAIADHMGLSAQVQLVETPPNWDYIDAGQLKYNRHVNVMVNPQPWRRKTVETTTNMSRLSRPTTGRRALVADINMPDGGVEFLPTTALDINFVRAQYFNNKAAEFLFAYDSRNALAYINRALQLAPDYSDAWVNVGVVYRRHQDYQGAIKAYQQALALNSDSFVALSGLRSTYLLMGDSDAADSVLPKIERIANKNPYHHYQRAKQAIETPEIALQHINKAISLRDKEYRFYHLKSLAEMKLGRYEQAQQSLQTAAAYSGIESSRYQAKVQALAEIAAK